MQASRPILEVRPFYGPPSTSFNEQRFNKEELLRLQIECQNNDLKGNKNKDLKDNSFKNI